MITGTYATLNDIRKDLAFDQDDTKDDSRLLDMLVDASRWINQETHRHFYVISETRLFSPLRSDRLRVDDLLSITTLKTDEDDDFDYDYTWATTDYHLEPLNRWPKTSIRVKPLGDYSFPIGVEKVQIAGTWGYGNADADGQGGSATPYTDSGTDTDEALDASETAVDVLSGIPFSAGQNILVESEQMYVQAVSANTLTVVRGVNGTTAATHATAKDIYIYQYPSAVKEACLIYAGWLWAQRKAPLGAMGSDGVQSTVRYADLIARRKIEPFRRIEAV